MRQNSYIELVSSYIQMQEKAQRTPTITRYPQSEDCEGYVKKFKINGGRLHLRFLTFTGLENEFLLQYI